MDKTLIVNWDNPSDLKKHISYLQIRRKNLLRQLGYNEINFAGSKYNYDNVFPILEDLYSTDMSPLNNNLDNNKIYYVYAHCNPLNKLNVVGDLRHAFLASKFNNITHIPFYIGKGIGNRCFDLNRNDSHRKIRHKILKSDQDIKVVKLAENLSEIDALSIEGKLIDILGLRAYTRDGMLCNLDEGYCAEDRRLLYNSNVVKLLRKNKFV